MKSISASAVDFHGYMRSGLNYGSQGGNAYCIGNGSKGHIVGRLGDECDTYAELSLSQEIYNKANNKFTIHTLIAYGTNEDFDGVKGQYDYQGNSWQGVGRGGDRAGDHDGTAAWNGQRTSLREAWAGYEMPSGIQLWAGKRFYQRKDIHIMDFYYLNNSGTGFGIENIGLNNLGSLSFALIKQQVDVDPTIYDWPNREYLVGKWEKTAPRTRDNAINSYKLDARWNGIPLWSDGTLDIALIYAWQHLSKEQKNAMHDQLSGNDLEHRSNTGFLAMVEWTQGNFFGGFNKLSVSYGKNGFDGVGGITDTANHTGDVVIPYGERGSGLRIIDWGVIEQSKWNLGYAFIFAHKHASGKNYEGANWSHPTGNEWAFVLRPSYKWSDYTSTVLEFGYASLANTQWTRWGDTERKDRLGVSKLTLAQQWSPSTQFWARPSIRVFASWLAGDYMNRQYTGLSEGKQHEYIFGAQVEAWW